MASKQTNSKYLKYSVRFSIIFSIFMMVFGYMKATAIVPYNVEKKETVFLESIEQLHNSKEGLYNDVCFLVADIEVTDSNLTLGTSEKKFVGTFDGNGHTVKLNYKSIEKDNSFFGFIGEGGVVENVHFIISGIDVKSNALALIAKVNEGTIKNCTLSFDDVRLNKSGIFSPLVRINKGTIQNVFVNGKFSNSAISLKDEEKTYMSSICVYNYGVVKNSIVSVEFNGFLTTDKEGILNKEYSNKTICALAYMNIGGGKTDNNRVLVAESTYLADQTIEFISIFNSDLVFDEITIFQILDFDNRYWVLRDGKLSLIVA